MLPVINNLILGLMDCLLGWLLLLPRDVAIIGVAVITSSVMVFPRKWVADQDWLKRCDNDQKRLKQLTREARKKKDKGQGKSVASLDGQEWPAETSAQTS